MQAELLSVENDNIWSAEALSMVEGKTNSIAKVRWVWLHVVEELRHACKFMVGTLEVFIQRLNESAYKGKE